MKNRNSPEYDTWREAILKRDKHRCQMPGCRKRSKLNVHHIQRWADAPFLRYDVSNGITLCAMCHKGIKNIEVHYISLFLEIVRNNTK